MIKNFHKIKLWFIWKKVIQKKKIIFNLKNKGLSNENIQEGINNLKTSYVNSELFSALIYARKKKVINFEKKKNYDENKKKLLQMSQAGFSYDIAKKIINLSNQKEFLDLEKYAKYADN